MKGGFACKLMEKYIFTTNLEESIKNKNFFGNKVFSYLFEFESTIPREIIDQ